MPMQSGGAGDAAAQWQQVPTANRDISGSGVTSLDQIVESMEILTSLSPVSRQKNLSIVEKRV